ncbi:hypothetical protein POM88_036684 [Heracleum sosnowskyi]|uniref:Uncharacterized protein n=1 Tax=Heracleum sosnowskyi TaxID=360622 RepID=A0AAD8MF68_9APIA|nr:hypothetical protein POM88_036684 [Heracleum sosnowskyi]
MPTLDLRFINYIITYFVGSTYKTCHLKLKLSLLQQLTLIHFLCFSLLCWAVCISILFKTRSNSIEGKQRFRCIEKIVVFVILSTALSQTNYLEVDAVNLESVYYSEMKDAGLFDADWE